MTAGYSGTPLAKKLGIKPRMRMALLSVPKNYDDLDENTVRETGLEVGLVDVKVCAVDNVWSGLKFVYRLRDRKH